MCNFYFQESCVTIFKYFNEATKKENPDLPQNGLSQLFWFFLLVVAKGHLSWSFYFVYVLGIVNSHNINYVFVSISSKF